MAYSPKSQKTYNSKCYYFSVKYTPAESDQADKLKTYLKETGQSANAYIKDLIKRDLDKKGIPYPDNTEN